MSAKDTETAIMPTPSLKREHITISASDTIRERTFEQNPLRHLEEKRLQMYEKIIEGMKAEGVLVEVMKPTGKPGEHSIILAVTCVR